MTRRLGQIIIGIAAILCFAIIVWDRSYYPVVSSPTAAEKTLAALICYGTTTALLLLSLGLAWIGYPQMHRLDNPLLELAYTSVGFLIAIASVSALFNPLIVIVYCAAAAITASTFIWDLLGCLSARRWTQALSALIYVFVSTAVMQLAGGVVINFE